MIHNTKNMGYKTISQILMVIASLVLVFALIMPKWEDIKRLQGEVEDYKRAIANIDQYNNELQRLLNEKENLGQNNAQKLETYLPNEVDVPVVMSDIELIAKMAGMKVLSMAQADDLEERGIYQANTGGNGNETEEGADMPELSTVDVSVRMVGTYDGLKKMLATLFLNKYPLVPVELKFASKDVIENVADPDNPLFDFALVLRTYSFSR